MGQNQEGYKVEGVFGGIELGTGEAIGETTATTLPAKRGFWAKFKEICLYKVDFNKAIGLELTPYQQKIEDEINAFLHQEITFEKIHNFLFQEVRFRKAK